MEWELCIDFCSVSGKMSALCCFVEISTCSLSVRFLTLQQALFSALRLNAWQESWRCSGGGSGVDVVIEGREEGQME